MMWLYLVVFLSAVAVDVIPLVAPPPWTVAIILLVRFHLHPWLVLPLCVTGSTLGRYLMMLLDGSRDRAAVLQELSRLVTAGAATVSQDGKPVTELTEALKILDQELDQNLAGLARSALLVA